MASPLLNKKILSFFSGLKYILYISLASIFDVFVIFLSRYLLSDWLVYLQKKKKKSILVTYSIVDITINKGKLVYKINIFVNNL